jgi:phasin family protein
MYQPPQSLAAFGSANFEATFAVANAALAGASRLVDLHLKAARDAVESAVASIRALTTATSPNDLFALQGSFAAPVVQKAAALARDAYAVAAETQTEVVRAMESRFASFRTDMRSAMDEAAKFAPAGSDAAIAAMKSVIQAADAKATPAAAKPKPFTAPANRKAKRPAARRR